LVHLAVLLDIQSGARDRYGQPIDRAAILLRAQLHHGHIAAMQAEERNSGMKEKPAYRLHGVMRASMRAQLFYIDSDREPGPNRSMRGVPWYSCNFRGDPLIAQFVQNGLDGTALSRLEETFVDLTARQFEQLKQSLLAKGVSLERCQVRVEALAEQ
jgi:hypothetical protein